jgi:hypothetical protein
LDAFVANESVSARDQLQDFRLGLAAERTGWVERLRSLMRDLNSFISQSRHQSLDRQRPKVPWAQFVELIEGNETRPPADVDHPSDNVLQFHFCDRS